MPEELVEVLVPVVTAGSVVLLLSYVVVVPEFELLPDEVDDETVDPEPPLLSYVTPEFCDEVDGRVDPFIVSPLLL